MCTVRSSLVLGLVLSLFVLPALMMGASHGQASAQSFVPSGSTAEGSADATDVSTQGLIDALENPDTRAKLIEALRQTDGTTAPAAGSATTNPAGAANTTGAVAQDEPPTLAARTAESSIQLILDVYNGALRVLREVGRLALLPDLLTPERQERILAEGLALLLTIVATTVVYRVLRRLSRRVKATQSVVGDLFSVRAVAFLLQGVLRLLSVVVAWATGYALAGFVFGEQGLALSQVLYLNAFLLVGLGTVLLSIFVSHDPRDMTFSRLTDRGEAVIYRAVRRTFALFSYGLVAVVPITQDWLNFVAARSFRTIIVTVGMLTALFAIHRISKVLVAENAKLREKARAAAALKARDAVAVEAELLADDLGDARGDPLADGDGETPAHESPAKRDASVAAQHVEPEQEEGFSQSIAGNTVGVWDRIWPALAYSYVVISYGIALANPNEMVELVGRATLLSGLGLAVLLVAMRMMALASEAPQIPLPGLLDRLLPPLAARLSGFLPLVLMLGGVMLLAVALGLLLEGWQLVELQSWLQNDGTAFFWRVASVVLIAAALLVGWSVMTSWIDTRLTLRDGGKQVSARSRTLLALFRNAVSIALVIFGGMTILSELGIDIAPLLAGAGVIGLAIGFGAQKLVQDIITGIFIQLENAINEGDVVTVAGITGGVEKLTIRSVGLRDLAGTYHLIPFSAVDTVSNFMRKFAYHVEVVGVAYDADLVATEKAMHDAFDAVKAGPLGAGIIAPLEWHGVTSLGDSSVNLRARIKTEPGQQWGIGRAYTGEVKKALDAAGIEIPFPHRELRLPAALIDRLAGMNANLPDKTDR